MTDCLIAIPALPDAKIQNFVYGEKHKIFAKGGGAWPNGPPP